MTEPLFEDRNAAGRRLAACLCPFVEAQPVIMAIPRGGVPVAAAAASALQLEWGIVVARKLPIPWCPEAGFGSVTADGAIVLNKPMLEALKMNPLQIDEVVQRVRKEIDRSCDLYGRIRPTPTIQDRTVIVVDDGLASGYTMVAAISSMRACGAKKVVAAAPVASRSAASLVKKEADDAVFVHVSSSIPFAVADAYFTWRDLTDEDIVPLLAGNAQAEPDNPVR